LAESVLLTPRQLAELRANCAPSFFSELGSAPFDPWRASNCRRVVEFVRTLRVTIQFPTEAGARRWNAYHERQIRTAGHFGTATLAVLVATISTPVMGVVAGTLSGVAKDELQARVWYPKVSRGWTLVREYELHYRQFPTTRFYTIATDVLIDHEGQLVERRAHGRMEVPIGGESDLPESLVESLFTQGPAERTVTFQ